MEICSESHEEIIYDSNANSHCPICGEINELKSEIEQLKDEKDNLETELKEAQEK